MLQYKYLGPFPEKFLELLDEEATAIMKFVVEQCGEEKGILSKAGPEKIDPEDRDFICYLMKPDPRDRPLAAEALAHTWLKAV